MPESSITPVGCLKEIGQSIFTQCLWPPIKSHLDYWWCFDNNIEDLTEGIQFLEGALQDMTDEIERARLRSQILKPWVVVWLKSGPEKLKEAIILRNGINPKAWNLISRYSKGKNARKTAKDIATCLKKGQSRPIAYDPPVPAMECSYHGQNIEFESRKQIEEEIIQSLKNSNVSVLVICGMAGVGKTTMVQKIRERVMKEDQFDEVVMVTFKQPMNESGMLQIQEEESRMLKIQEDVALWLDLKFETQNIPVRALKLHKRLEDDKRKIIIFDNVWERLKLEELGVYFKIGFERCKIILTTRFKDVCEQIDNKKIIVMEILTKDEACNLFKEKAGYCVEKDKDLREVAIDVVAECKGLPTALVTVGRFLGVNKKYPIWKDSLNKLREAKPVEQEFEKEVYNRLESSYGYLSNDERLLFLLCCLFPKGYDIPVEQLTWYIIGLQILDDSASIDVARCRTHTLVNKVKGCFFLIEGQKKHDVKMHDIVRDVAIRIGEANGFLKSMNNFSKENSSNTDCNWMSVYISDKRMEVPIRWCFPKLCLMMLLKSSYPEFSNISFEEIRDLKVLSFSNISIVSLPPGLELLKNLRTLYLYKCSVQNISVIGKLTGLKILCCYGCHNMKELPTEIGRLNQLRLLEFYDCNIQIIPFGIISNLVQLEELKFRKSFTEWETGVAKRNAALKELESLSHLTWLEIEIDNFNLVNEDISLSPQNLIRYCINIASCDSDIRERDNAKATYLNLPSHITAVGEWIWKLVRSTEDLSLEGDGSNIFNIAEIETLRNLKFSNCSTVKKLVKTEDCKSGIVFPQLETLNLFKLEKLEQIWDDTIIINETVSLFDLKFIDISHSSNLRSLFSVSVARRCLSKLEVLKIQSCHKLERVFCNEITDETDVSIVFPKLKELTLDDLPNLTAFCQGVQTIKFPNLTLMVIGNLPKLNSLSPLDSEPLHDDDTITSLHFLCNQKVEMDGLKTLSLLGLGDNIRNIWCHQIPTNFFRNLEELVIFNFNGIRSLMSYLIAKYLVNLKYLSIQRCLEMVEVIEGGDRNVDDIKFLFPTLTRLEIWHAQKLTRFWQCKHVLEMPLLEEVTIRDCPVMETFTFGSLNTPNIKWIDVRNQRINDQKDLNHVIHHFWTKDHNRD